VHAVASAPEPVVLQMHAMVSLGCCIFSVVPPTAGLSKLTNTPLYICLDPSHPLCTCSQSFFIKWWGERSEAVHSRVRSLVTSGQLQFVNGGVVQHDEATSHYSSIVDQMSTGMR
jgi:hypothetical protein